MVSETFGALISRLRELNIYVPDIEEHAAGRLAIDQNTNDLAALRQQLAAVSLFLVLSWSHLMHVFALLPVLEYSLQALKVYCSGTS